MSREITISPKLITKEYPLFEGEKFQIYAIFNKWCGIDGRKVMEVEFRLYPLDKFMIRDVHFCAGKDQLRISVVNKIADNPFIKEFGEESEFYINEGKKEDVLIIYFDEGEKYEDYKCDFIPGSNNKPKRKKGNILVGG
ncbi:hypothetical protein [Kordia sp.]|uniref:hypothetical protein n=1 Tax=Kordia sp. TaxID=1965332 RepID=UPI0025B7F8FC|nr:hypothetical protein [Kordia sp.]MCH2194660.1 hypothetical protein [Kordia sp.]